MVVEEFAASRPLRAKAAAAAIQQQQSSGAQRRRNGPKNTGTLSAACRRAFVDSLGTLRTRK
jgi:hypothetical protein